MTTATHFDHEISTHGTEEYKSAKWYKTIKGIAVIASCAVILFSGMIFVLYYNGSSENKNVQPPVNKSEIKDASVNKQTIPNTVDVDKADSGVPLQTTVVNNVQKDPEVDQNKENKPSSLVKPKTNEDNSSSVVSEEVKPEENLQSNENSNSNNEEQESDSSDGHQEREDSNATQEREDSNATQGREDSNGTQEPPFSSLSHGIEESTINNNPVITHNEVAEINENVPEADSAVSDNETNTDNPLDKIFFASNVRGSKEKKIMSVRSDGTGLTTWDQITDFIEPFFITEDNKTLFYLCPDYSIIYSLDLTKGKEAEPVMVHVAHGKTIVEFSVRADGELIMMRTLNRSFGNLLIEIIEKDGDDKWSVWRNPVQFRRKLRVGLDVMTISPDKDSIIFAKAGQLCEVPYIGDDNRCICEAAGMIEKIYAISPDAKLFVYLHKDEGRFIVADSHNKEELYTFYPDSYDKFIIHKWTDDGLYVSYRKKGDEFSSLYKWTFNDGKCNQIGNIQININLKKTKALEFGNIHRKEYVKDDVVNDKCATNLHEDKVQIKVPVISPTMINHKEDIFFTVRSDDEEKYWRLYSYSPIAQVMNSWRDILFDTKVITAVTDNGDTLVYTKLLANKKFLSFMNLSSDKKPRNNYKYNDLNLDLFDFTVSLDGNSLVLHGIVEDMNEKRGRRDGQLKEELILVDYDESHETWEVKLTHHIQHSYHLKFPTLSADKSTIWFAIKRYDERQEICKLSVGDESRRIKNKSVEEMGPSDIIVKISPDAKYFAYTKRAENKLIIATIEDHQIVSEFAYNDSYVIHRWVDNSIYISFLSQEENKSILAKLTYTEGNPVGIMEVLRDKDNETVSIINYN